MSNLDTTSAIDHNDICTEVIENTGEIAVIQSNTSCIFVRKRKTVWILLAIFATILIILAITIPTIFFYKKKMDAETATNITTATINTTPTATTIQTTVVITTTTTIKEASLHNISINYNTKWKQDGITIAGGHGYGGELNQFRRPYGIYVYDDQTIYIADSGNDRIVEWKCGAKTGRVAAGGNGDGNRNDQLWYPLSVIVDKEDDSLIICDRANRRVTKWSRINGTTGQAIISDIDCYNLIMDNERSLYVTDYRKHEVKRWKIGDMTGTTIAGGSSKGNNLNQLTSPTDIFVDQNHSVYISDERNYRVMKWMKGAKEGIVVVRGQSPHSDPTQMNAPSAVIVDQLGQIYVADVANNRIMRWTTNETVRGRVVLGGNGNGAEANQFSSPLGLSSDQHGNLYVVDEGNSRIQKFYIDSN